MNVNVHVVHIMNLIQNRLAKNIINKKTKWQFTIIFDKVRMETYFSPEGVLL